MLIAQLTDSHVHTSRRFPLGAFDTAGALERCVGRLIALDPPPDVAVFTGDLTQRGRPAEYARFREAIAPLRMPFLVLPGNHDEREAFRAAFSDLGVLPASGPLNYVDERFAIRLVAVDSTEPGRAGGSLDATRLAWLERTLAADRRPTLLMLHQAPFAAGIVPLDSFPFAGAAALREIVERNPHVVRIICGHLHCTRTRRWGATTVESCPSTSDQFVPCAGPGAGFPHIDFEPAAFRLLAWDGSHMRARTVRVRKSG
jgi:3',5'-cyclic AMP phosphodiesterase CpdA